MVFGLAFGWRFGWSSCISGCGWLAIELVCLGFWVVGCWWAYGGRGVVGDGFGGFRLAVGGFKMCLW